MAEGSGADRHQRGANRYNTKNRYEENAGDAIDDNKRGVPARLTLPAPATGAAWLSRSAPIAPMLELGFDRWSRRRAQKLAESYRVATATTAAATTFHQNWQRFEQARQEVEL